LLLDAVSDRRREMTHGLVPGMTGDVVVGLGRAPKLLQVSLAYVFFISSSTDF
jgi:hypothetical protein